MSDSNAPEPTMEEILASIRRIISEDEPAAAPAAPEPEFEAPPAPEPEAEDVLELTDPVHDDASPIETHGDLDIHAHAPAPPAQAPVAAASPAPAPEPVYVAPSVEGSLLSDDAAASAASSFGQLTQHLLMPADGRTLEDVVRELLKPLLKTWLDAHLPAIVQAKVDEEVERIARRRMG